MHFQKYHGLGNDYIVMDPAVFPAAPSPSAIQAICDRNRGVGSDGILYGPLPVPGQGGAFRLRIFNPDGSEAKKSGNGLRIFSRYLSESGRASDREFSVLTLGGLVRSTIVDRAAWMIRVDMGAPSFLAKDIPAAFGLDEVIDHPFEFAGVKCRITCISMGNPHCVVTGLPADEATARSLGPAIENSGVFPDRTNVQFLEVLSRSEISIRIWERGAGYTLASGSSSCAAAAAARRLGLVGDGVTVRMPGGALDLVFSGGSVLMTGPAEKVCEGYFSDELLARAGLAAPVRG